MFIINPQKQQYFNSEGASYLLKNSEWKKQFDACDCYKCSEYDCKARGKKTRFPTDVGGDGQCIRLEQLLSEFAFVNKDKTVVVIPDEIVENIINRTLERCFNDH